MDDREYTLIEHLTELRTRVVRAGVGVFVAMFVCFAASKELIDLLKEPLKKAVAGMEGVEASFVVIAPAEYFMAQLKASLVAGIFVASPWVLLQLWKFVSPGLYEHERRWATSFVVAGALFFVGGGLFAYFVVFQDMFVFFLKSTQEADVAMTLSIAEHLSFSLKLLLAFGVTFQAPVIVFVLSMAGIVDPKTLGKYRPYVFVAGFILGAILTPPDILSQTLLALPLLLLFELGLVASRVVMYFKGTPLKRQREADKNAKDGSEPPVSDEAKK